MKHAKITLMEQLKEISNVIKDTLRLWLKRRADFWIIKPETLSPKGLNQELNDVWNQIIAFSVHLILIYCNWEERKNFQTYDFK